MSIFSVFRPSLVGLTCVCSTAFSATVHSQEGSDPSEESGLETIVVTALKRKDISTDLANSVTVLGKDDLAVTAIDPGASITRAAPNFYFGGFGQPGIDYVNLRGIGPLGQPSNSLDNSVGFATNGVGTSAFGFAPSLLDIDRIEVVRGPQGTLFGRNALGGAVNVVTRAADGEREVSILGELGTEGHLLTEGKIAGWLSDDKLATRIAARYQKIDGSIPNIIVGGEEGDAELFAARGSFRLLASENTTVNLMLSFDKDDRKANYNMFKEHPDAPVSGSDVIPTASRDRKEGILEIQHAFDATVLTATTGFQDITLENRLDTADALLFENAFGFIPPSGADLSVTKDNEKIFTQEIRLNSLEGSDYSWVVGANIFHSDYDSARQQVSSYSPYSSGNFETKINSTTLSAFADVTVPFSERFDLSGGLRIAHDKQKLDVDYTGIGFPGTPESHRQSGEISDTYLTGRAAARYHATDTTMLYASVAHGYSSGGFERYTLNAAVGMDTVPFKPTRIWTYEAGLKYAPESNKAELSLALFYNDVSNGQLVAADYFASPITFSFINQDYETYGAELSLRAFVTDNFKLHAGLGISKSKIKNIGKDAVTGTEEGNQVPAAPEVTASIAAHYDFTSEFYTTAQYQYVGKRAVDIQNTDNLAAYHNVNVRLGWDNGTIKVYGFANNLLDERAEYFGSTYGPETHTYVVGPSRVIGIGVGASF